MSILEIFVLAIALSIDAFIVSFTYGLTFEKNRTQNALLLATFTGLFQGIMPCLGYFLTNCIKTYISPYSSLIVFLIFLFLGIKFIKDSFDIKKSKPACIGIKCLFLIGIATSIDAFSAGITLLLYGNTILKPALLITLITFFNSCLGFKLGGKLRKFSTQWLEIFAGVLLIGLGVKAII